MGARPGGQRIALSFTAPLPPEPVLSPATQSAGIPERGRAKPVRRFFIHAMSWERACADQASPPRILFIVLVIAAGVVVSRSSPGILLLRLGSLRSSRVTESP